jgi:hypothetical protein
MVGMDLDETVSSRVSTEIKKEYTDLALALIVYIVYTCILYVYISYISYIHLATFNGSVATFNGRGNRATFNVNIATFNGK